MSPEVNVRLQKTLMLPPQRGSLVPFQGCERIKRSSLKVLPSGAFPAANLGSRFFVVAALREAGRLFPWP